MKIFIFIMLVVVCTLVGIAAGKKYAARERFFFQLQLFCQRMKGEIRFSRTLLHESLSRCGEDYGGQLGEYIKAYMRLLDTASDIDIEVLRKTFSRGILKGGEYETVLQLFDTLGKTDAVSQEEGLNGFCEAFKVFHTPALEEKKKYGGLYTKLGFLAGLTLAILLI